MQAYMGITANILALLDGDALDDRSMMRGREEIIQQYIEQARSEPYGPGNCSFCGERPVAAGSRVRALGRSSAARLNVGQRRHGSPVRYASVLSKRTTARVGRAWRRATTSEGSRRGAAEESEGRDLDAANDARPAGGAVLGAAPGLIPPSLQVHSRTLAPSRGAVPRRARSARRGGVGTEVVSPTIL